MQSRKVVVAISAAVAVVAAGVALLIAGVGTATADEVRFQNVADPGPAPFTTPTDAATGAPSSPSVRAAGTSADSASASRAENGRSPLSEGVPLSESATDSSTSTTAKGEAPSRKGGSESKRGAFGGSGKEGACDREQLINELAADPEKLSAWAEAVGIDDDPQSVADFIRELRPSTLTQDTQVTNHAYVLGQVKPYQALLPAGTAVLVDEDGTPVVRCRCGNPLTEPLQLEPQTKCIECPSNYSPPPPCEGECSRPAPDPPPTKPIGTPPPEPTAPPDTGTMGTGTEPTGTGAGAPDKGAGTPGTGAGTGAGGTGAGTNTPPAQTTPPPDQVKLAKDALAACRTAKKGPLTLCATEYEAARSLCAKDPLNASCGVDLCFEQILGIANDSCPSYLVSAKDHCFRKPFTVEISAADCEKMIGDLAFFCAFNADKCASDLSRKKGVLIGLCAKQSWRSECPTMQIECAKDSAQARSACGQLIGTCIADPDRRDCKAIDALKQICKTDPTKPECKPFDELKQACAQDSTTPLCKDVPKTAAPTLRPDEEGPGEEAGEDGEEPDVGEEAGADTEADPGGGEGTDTGGPPVTEPAPTEPAPPEDPVPAE